MASGVQRKRQRRKQQLLAHKPWCRWCGKKLSASTATIEHVQPLSLGGSNSRSNMELACRPCNSTRGNDVRWSFRNGHHKEHPRE